MYSRRYKIKAAFLLFVFALNTVVSFACSTSGVLHKLHHKADAESTAHQHKSNSHKHQHSHSHKQDGKHNHSDKDQKGKDDCCSNNVVSLQKADKSVSRSIEAPNVSFVSAFLLSYFSLPNSLVQENTFFPDDIRRRLPTTIQDLRIVIQSFQI